MKENYRAQNLMGVLVDLEAKRAIAEAAISWREALLGGRFDKAADHQTTLCILIDDYVRSRENTDNPGDTGVHPDESDTDAARAD